MTKRVFCTADSVFSAGSMFKKAGWEVVNNIEECDIVYFMTGPDPNPKFYNQERGKYTHFNPQRDLKDFAFWIVADLFKKPCVGAGRGAIFLNSMCNGDTWQHVNSHCHGHPILDLITGDTFVSQASSHHQMMEPAVDGEVVWIASQSTQKEKIGPSGLFTMKQKTTPLPGYKIRQEKLCLYDVEAVIYRHSRVLCIQPVPEFTTDSKIKGRFFQLIDEIL